MRLRLLILFSILAAECLQAATLKDSLVAVLADSGGDFSSYAIVDCCRMQSRPKAFAIIGPLKSEKGERLAQYSFADSAWELDWIDKDRHQHPWKIMTGDANSDSTEDLAICVFKKPKFWPDSGNGFFVYKVTEKSIAPLWLGSRLSLPFIDAELTQRPGSSTTSLFAIEKHSKGKRAVRYEWKSFGFFVVEILATDTEANSVKEFLLIHKEKL